MSYDWANNYTKVDQSNFVTGYVDVTATLIKNPTITVDSVNIGVLYYLSATDATTNVRILQTSNLSNIGPGTVRSYSYTTINLNLIDAYFVKTDIGQ